MNHDMNKVSLVGSVAYDAAVRAAGSSEVLNVKIETIERYTGRDGAMRDSRQIHGVVLWGRKAADIGTLQAGDRVHVEGTLRNSSYEKDGEKKWKTEVQASSLVVIEARPTEPRHAAPPPDSVGQDDIPF